METQTIRKPELNTFIKIISKSKDLKSNYVHQPKFSQIMFFNKVERKNYKKNLINVHMHNSNSALKQQLIILVITPFIGVITTITYIFFFLMIAFSSKLEDKLLKTQNYTIKYVSLNCEERIGFIKKFLIYVNIF